MSNVLEAQLRDDSLHLALLAAFEAAFSDKKRVKNNPNAKKIAREMRQEKEELLTAMSTKIADEAFNEDLSHGEQKRQFVRNTKIAMGLDPDKPA